MQSFMRSLSDGAELFHAKAKIMTRTVASRDFEKKKKQKSTSKRQSKLWWVIMGWAMMAMT